MIPPQNYLFLVRTLSHTPSPFFSGFPVPVLPFRILIPTRSIYWHIWHSFVDEVRPRRGPSPCFLTDWRIVSKMTEPTTNSRVEVLGTYGPKGRVKVMNDWSVYVNWVKIKIKTFHLYYYHDGISKQNSHFNHTRRTNFVFLNTYPCTL